MGTQSRNLVALKHNILHLVLHNEYSFATVSINLRRILRKAETFSVFLFYGKCLKWFISSFE